MFRLVLFDIDGTLIHSRGAGQKAFAQVCEEIFGVPDGIRGLHFAGRTDTAIVGDFFRAHQIPANSANQSRFLDAYLTRLQSTLEPGVGEVLPGVAEWLAALAPRHPDVVTGLLTGNVREGARLKLSHYGLWEHFHVGAYGDDHHDRKEVAAVALRRGRDLFGAPLEPEELLVVGDTPEDIACARAIGAKVLAVATGQYTREELGGLKPDWLATDLKGITPEMVLGGG